MQIVIDIPEKVHKSIINGKNYISYQEYIEDAIKNGTPLPKGHGRLIDISPYEQWFNPTIQYDDGDHINQVYTRNAPTIIEADKAESEDICG